MRKWKPEKEVPKLLHKHGFEIRGKKLLTLYYNTKFYISDAVPMLGITLSKSKVYFDSIILPCTYRKQAQSIVHELTHVAQFLDMGWVKFMATYVKEWVKAGFSYRNMKHFGLEKEAYDNECRFKLRALA